MTFKNIFTLKSLIIFGFVIAVFPLLLGAMYAALVMRDTAALNRSINFQVFEQTKTVGLVLQKSSEIERKARLFVLLSDPSLREPYDLESYETARAGFKRALNELLILTIDNKITLLADELAEKENLIYQQIIGSANQKNPNWPVDEAFLALRESSNTLSKEFEKLVDHQFNDLNQKSESLEQALLLKGAILLLISLTSIVFLLRMISRSMGQLNLSICRLGSGDLSKAIRISGPADLRFLGNYLEWLRMHLLGLKISKQQYMQNVAREIEEPLEIVRQSAAQLLNLLNDVKTNSSKEECALLLSANVKKLTSVSDELLRYAQIISAPEIQHKQIVNMADLIDSVIEEYQSDFKAKSLSLKKLVKPVEISGITSQLRCIMEQLLANAVKFSPMNGEIRIILRDSGIFMELEVEDESPGIAADERSYVFEPFFRGKANQSGDMFEGSELGLSIVKEYVLNHQGNIAIIETKDDQHGTRIRVRIPIATKI